MAKNDSKTDETQTEESAGGAKLVRKITNKVLFSSGGNKPRLPVDDKGNPVAIKRLGTVMGIARSVKSGDHDFGPWTKLVGQFEAHTHDGRTVQSPHCILPEPIQTMIAESLADDATDSVQFAVHVNMVAADTAVGYEYQTETVVDTGRADPLADLRSKALPAA